MRANLLRALVRRGVRFQWGTELTRWCHTGARVTAAITSAGELRADEYVLAGGSWSPATLRGLGLNVPVQAGKGYSLTLPRPRQMPRVCSILTEARVAVTPMGDALRFAGTMEIAGLNDRVDPRRVRGIIDAIRPTSRRSRPPTSTASPPGPACGRARPTACRTSAASPATPTCRPPPATA